MISSKLTGKSRVGWGTTFRIVLPVAGVVIEDSCLSRLLIPRWNYNDD